MMEAQPTGPLRRRQWSAIEKLQIVKQSLAADANVAEVARRYNVSTGLIYSWRKQAKTGALSTTRANPSGFALVAVASGSSATRAVGRGDDRSMVEVVLRNGRILRVPERAGPGRAASLADALEGGRS